MAGGVGSRLGMGEKPLVTICGKPMIAYVLDAFAAAGHETAVIASPRTPYTRNWCRARGIDLYEAGGAGYIEDLQEAAAALDLTGPAFTCVADLPCLTTEIVRAIEERYRASMMPACSVWVPRDLCREHGCRTEYIETVEGVAACPVGINIVDAGALGEPQDEVQILLCDRRLAFNINTRDELARVQSFLC
ncbi:5-deoxyadenosylcobinamide phosphate nucleotidyltransferase [Methanoculleus sp. FWC-SCC1]|uniref:5-deoxyadenosylcobinamide phosphate nucleotidyltransferase n=2 Tax=Methanoculleus frigidifontis TaxID=2584085 RepID=A0ABT8M6H5_9EURY|nr:5-deoxyadenosylcobinamide phosphate nucleotidyltransferase [Methanoculleus sp. FWC-SCC1]